MLFLIPPRVCVQSFMMIGWVVFVWWCDKQTDFHIYNISKIMAFVAFMCILSLVTKSVYSNSTINVLNMLEDDFGHFLSALTGYKGKTFLQSVFS